jgi:hypothetical protein
MSDSLSGAAGVSSVGETNGRFGKRRGRRVIRGRKKRVIQRAAQRACCRQETEICDSASGAAGKRLKRERNKRFSERRRLAHYNRQAWLLLKWIAMSNPVSEAVGETEQSGVQRGGFDDCHGERRGGGAIHRPKAAHAATITLMQGNRPQSTNRKCHAASGMTQASQ